MPPELAPAGAACLGAAVTAACVAMWSAWGQPWEVFGDAAHYLAAARGESTEAPFAFRPLAPALAQGVAWATGAPLLAAFHAVLVAALVATGAVLASWARRPLAAATVALFWGLSHATAFGTTVGATTDPVFLLALVGAVRLASTEPMGRGTWRALGVAGLVALGVLAHEMALFALVVIGVRKALRARAPLARGGATAPGWGALALAGGAAVAALAAVHAQIVPLPATVPNWTGDSPLELARWVVDYGGGPARYPLRVYAAFGPAALFALAALAERSPRERLADVTLVLGAVALTLLATDTLRVMALAAVVVLPLAAAFVVRRAERGAPGLAAAAVGLQAVYAALVCGHLRTFEGDLALQGAAAVASLAALALALGAPFADRSAGPPLGAPARASLSPAAPAPRPRRARGRRAPGRAVRP